MEKKSRLKSGEFSPELRSASAKYTPLGEFLSRTSVPELWLSLDKIENLVGKLPLAAQTPQFWANVAAHHSSRRSQWLDANYGAYFRPRDGEPGVLFSKRVKAPKQEKAGRSWTESELRGCVQIYKTMLDDELAGRTLNKSAARRSALSSFLSRRNASSYEFRMQNISALMEELHLPRIKGYLPRRNVGTVRVSLLRLINEALSSDGGAALATSDPSALQARSLAAQLMYEFTPNLAPGPGRAAPVRRPAETWSFVRDPAIVGWVLAHARGKCEICDDPAPFLTRDAQPYLEVHHVRPLAEGGPDTIDNACATCPTCHRRLHYGSDSQRLRLETIKKIERLVDYPITAE